MSDIETATGDRHATWTELFFDLVAVAGVAALSHVLVGDLTWGAVGLYALLFIAFWQTWAAFMLYGTVGGDAVHLIQILIGMFGIGVMSSAIPEVAHWTLDGAHGDHAARGAHVFAIAYVLTRVAASKAFGNRIVIDLPSLQPTMGTLPWLASVFVDDLTVVIVLWCVGIATDVFGILLMAGERFEQQVQHRFEQRHTRVARSPRADDPRTKTGLDRLRMQTVTVAGAHFGERLGLFVIIVLGEGVVQVVNAASTSGLNVATAFAGFIAFALLATIFVMALVVGHAGVPRIDRDNVAPRYLMLLHALTTATIIAIAVGLAQVVDLGNEHASDSARWLLCGAVAFYLGIGLVASVLTRRTAIASGFGWLVAGVTAPVLIGLCAEDAAAILVEALLLTSALATLAMIRTGRSASRMARATYEG